MEETKEVKNAGGRQAGIGQPLLSAVFVRVKLLYSNYRYKKNMKYIRSSMLLFGHNVSNMTDDEIEQGVIECGKILAGCGITAQEASKRLIKLAKYCT